MRPSETHPETLAGSRSTQRRRSVSIPWPIATTFRESSGNERRSTLRTAVESRSASDERPARLPVREPEEQRDAPRPHERGGEDRVERDAVRDDRERPRRELAGEARDEAAAALGLRRRAEDVDAAVLGQRALDRPVGEHDHLVDPARRARGACRRPPREPGRRDRRPAWRRRAARHRKSRSPSSKCGRAGTALAGVERLSEHREGAGRRQRSRRGRSAAAATEAARRSSTGPPPRRSRRPRADRPRPPRRRRSARAGRRRRSRPARASVYGVGESAKRQFSQSASRSTRSPARVGRAGRRSKRSTRRARGRPRHELRREPRPGAGAASASRAARRRSASRRRSARSAAAAPRASRTRSSFAACSSREDPAAAVGRVGRDPQRHPDLERLAADRHADEADRDGRRPSARPPRRAARRRAGPGSARRTRRAPLVGAVAPDAPHQIGDIGAP